MALLVSCGLPPPPPGEPPPQNLIITFETNGGTDVNEYYFLASNPVNISSSSKETTKSGYFFDGWYFDVALSEPFVQGAYHAQNFTLYAKWTDNVMLTTDNFFTYFDVDISLTYINTITTYYGIFTGSIGSKLDFTSESSPEIININVEYAYLWRLNKTDPYFVVAYEEKAFELLKSNNYSLADIDVTTTGERPTSSFIYERTRITCTVLDTDCVVYLKN